MKRLASITVLVALVLTACGGGIDTDPAATVDGTVITVGEVEDLMSDDTSLVDQPTFAQFLGASIQLQIMFRAAEEDFGVVVSDAEVAEEADRLYAENGIDLTREEFLAQAGISELMLQAIGGQQLVIQRVREAQAGNVEATPEQMEEARQAAEWSLAEVCLAHILVATEDEAIDVLGRLGSGEDFGALAVELSTDTVSGEEGGDLGCSPPARYVEPFAAASMTVDLNTPSDPVMSNFGYHILLVNDRTEADPDELPTDEELAEQIEPALLDEAFNEWFTAIVTAANVVVEPEYGTWSPGPPPSVTPPA